MKEIEVEPSVCKVLSLFKGKVLFSLSKKSLFVRVGRHNPAKGEWAWMKFFKWK